MNTWILGIILFVQLAQLVVLISVRDCLWKLMQSSSEDGITRVAGVE